MLVAQAWRHPVIHITPLPSHYHGLPQCSSLDVRQPHSPKCCIVRITGICFVICFILDLSSHQLSSFSSFFPPTTIKRNRPLSTVRGQPYRDRQCNRRKHIYPTPPFIAYLS